MTDTQRAARKNGNDALTSYLAHEAKLKLDLVPMYREMAAFQRYMAEDLQRFIDSPDGHDVAQLRAVLTVEVKRICNYSRIWDRQAEEAEAFVVANLPREMAVSC